MKQVTLWYRRNNNNASWQYNHLSNGYDVGKITPDHVCSEQQKSWISSQWLPFKGIQQGFKIIQQQHFSDIKK